MARHRLGTGCGPAGGQRHARGGEAATVRAERHATNTFFVRPEDDPFLAGGRLPDPHGPIPAGGGETASVWAEHDPSDRARVPPERTQVELQAVEIVPFETTQIDIVGMVGLQERFEIK